MGVRPIELLRALSDRPRSRVDELAARLRRPSDAVSCVAEALRRAGVLAYRPGPDVWVLTPAGRQLLAAHDRLAVSPASEKLDWMMRQNRSST